MASSRFLDALRKLSVARRNRVKAELAAWKRGSWMAGIDRPQLARNIEAEQALTVTVFTSLLKGFAELLAKGEDGVIAWKSACSSHSLSGPPVPPPAQPIMLGRAAKLGAYASHLQRHCSMRAIDHALVKNAGKATPSASLSRQMASATFCAGKIVWATFSPPPDSNPFTGLPQDTAAVRTSLGLGCADETTPFILFQYHPDSASSLTLHRPTVADAGTYHHFRPNPNPTASWGFTHPLSPNPRKLKGRPELVHPQITGKFLVFPYLLTST
ncbi:MAG: hypothetical protein K9N23_02540 [Akkermansiaceae bacterium]|nr:hypothetical protein [Akkermansiaceae bacterium]